LTNLPTTTTGINTMLIAFCAVPHIRVCAVYARCKNGSV